MNNIGYGWRQNQEAKLKVVGGVIPWFNQQEDDPTNKKLIQPEAITSVIVS